ncbi:MAG: hypothetical protein O2877_00315 [bacterium]|nr:hypothetical protein [bacterium]
MTHPHAHLLSEVEIAIKKLPPTLTDLSKEAQSKLKAMEADENVTEETILSFLAEIGRKEFPHRHALNELHTSYGEGVEVSMILEHP